MDSADLTLEETPDGLQVIYGGRRLYDSAPSTTAGRKAARLPLQEQTLYLLASPVAWHGVRELAKALPASSFILAVEADPLLYELANRLKPESLDAHVLGFCRARSTDVAEVLTRRNPRGAGAFRRVRQVSFATSATLNAAGYRGMRQALEHDIRTSWQNRLTLSAMGRLWFTNIFRNLVHGAHPVVLTKTDRPIVVCGAGPTLDLSVEELAGIRKHVTVIAADTALPALQVHGINPDIVVALEAQVHNVSDFVPSHRTGYRLIADIASNSVAISAHHSTEVGWFLSQLADLPLLDRLADSGLDPVLIPPLGSVGVAAVWFALHMTTGDVYLSGLDFSAPAPRHPWGSGSTHARGTPQHLRVLLERTRITCTAPHHLRGRWLERNGVAGHPVLTTMTMIGYAEQVAQLIASDAGRSAGRNVCAVECRGMNLGAVSVTADELTHRVHSCSGEPRESDEGVRQAPPDTAARPAEHALSFLKAEAMLLDSLVDALDAAGERITSDLVTAFEPCTYVAAGFPDFTGTLREDPSFLRRLSVAADYYQSVLESGLRLLRS